MKKKFSENLTLLLLKKAGKLLVPFGKALSKQEGPNVFWILFLNLNQLPGAKKGLKKWASQQTFGTSCFDRALHRSIV